MNFFTPIRNWRIPQAVLAASLREMARDGVAGNEGVAFWLGRRDNGQADVTHVVTLRGSGVVKRPDLLVIPPWLVNDLTDVAVEHGLVLVGQIHSHGDQYGVDLSFADRTFGVAVPHFLSVVAPGYALRPHTRLVDCGVHLFEAGSGFRRLPVEEIGERLHIVSGIPASVLSVGEE